jgi:hypothetical protein
MTDGETVKKVGTRANGENGAETINSVASVASCSKTERSLNHVDVSVFLGGNRGGGGAAVRLVREVDRTLERGDAEF